MVCGAWGGEGGLLIPKVAFLILILRVPLPASQALRLWTRGSGSRKESAAGRNEEGWK